MKTKTSILRNDGYWDGREDNHFSRPCKWNRDGTRDIRFAPNGWELSQKHFSKDYCKGYYEGYHG